MKKLTKPLEVKKKSKKTTFFVVGVRCWDVVMIHWPMNFHNVYFMVCFIVALHRNLSFNVSHKVTTKKETLNKWRKHFWYFFCSPSYFSMCWLDSFNAWKISLMRWARFVVNFFVFLSFAIIIHQFAKKFLVIIVNDKIIIFIIFFIFSLSSQEVYISVNLQKNI